jgi:hypothetical protein
MNYERKASCVFLSVLLLCSLIFAEVIVEYSAPGDPAAQQWAADVRGVLVGDANDVARGLEYPVWFFQSQLSQTAWYLNSNFTADQKTDIMTNGWTMTYIARTNSGTAKGSHYVKFRDGKYNWEFYFIQGTPTNANNGFWVSTSSSTVNHKIASMQLR